MADQDSPPPPELMNTTGIEEITPATPEKVNRVVEATLPATPEKVNRIDFETPVRQVMPRKAERRAQIQNNLEVMVRRFMPCPETMAQMAGRMVSSPKPNTRRRRRLSKQSLKQLKGMLQRWAAEAREKEWKIRRRPRCDGDDNGDAGAQGCM